MGKALDFAWTALREFYRYAAPYWPVLLGLLILYFIVLIIGRSQSSSSNGNIPAIDYFTGGGYQVEAVHSQGRLGSEYTMYRLGMRFCIHQRWGRKVTDVEPVRALAVARDALGCDYAILVSKEGFTRKAHRLAQKFGIRLWLYHRLEIELRRFDGGIDQGMKAVAASKSSN